MARLTAKQQRFIDAYCGNGTDAARKAGYAGSDQVLAQVARENLKKPQIASAIATREKPKTNKLIASREDRQAFWSKVMNDEDRGDYERLRASELLGKSEADFTEKVDVSGTLTVSIAINGIAKGPA